MKSLSETSTQFRILKPLEADISDQPSVILVAQATYHLDELLPLSAALKKKGLQCLLVTPIPASKTFYRWRPAAKRYEEILIRTGVQDEFVLSEKQQKNAAALVVLNDWGTPAAFVRKMKEQGTPTFGWVEGVQDFADIDTGQQRNPYQNVDHVFCLGHYDFDFLKDVKRTLIGSERLRKIWSEDLISPQSSQVLVNLNFTYGVGSQHRRTWLKSVRKACQETEQNYIISQHAADKGVVAPWRRSTDSVSDVLKSAPYFVTRFSTLGYEALLRGVPMAYHNPHGERVTTFAEAKGAFDVTDSTAALISALKSPPLGREEVRKRAEDFLHHHLRLDGEDDPSEIAADCICSAVRS